MFSGIIEDIGTVSGIRTSGASLDLDITTDLDGIAPGDSIAVQGVCLTVGGIKGNTLSFFVMGETCRLSSLPGLRPGARVNMERSLKAGDRIAGHFVTGHIDCLAHITRIAMRQGTYTVEVQVPRDKIGFLTSKGSVALDGVSLTVIRVGRKSFTVGLVPFTQNATTLGACRQGDKVNIEFDIFGKYCAYHAQKGSRAITEDFLKEHGFV